jgi:hypothetical protein
VKRSLVLLAGTVMLLLGVKLFGYVSRPLGIHAYHVWLIGGLAYLVCSLSVLLEAPVRRVLRRVASRLFTRRVSDESLALANDAEIARVARRFG